MWRVMIVEDDARTRAFFEASVARSAQLSVCASLATVAEARHWLESTAPAPDVLLTDLGLPDGSGLEVIRLALRRHPRCEPLVISMFGDEDNVLASIEAGALGYILKDSAPDDIARTILDMRAGASPISPMVARRVLTKYRDARPPGPADAPPGLLTAREQEVLSLVARGFSYAEIARLTSLSIHTVQGYIKSLYGKLSVHSRSEAVFEATRMGLLRPHG